MKIDPLFGIPTDAHRAAVPEGWTLSEHPEHWARATAPDGKEYLLQEVKESGDLLLLPVISRAGHTTQVDETAAISAREAGWLL